MQLYRVEKYEGGGSGWSRTLAEAHEDAKLSSSRDSVRIYLEDYPSDQGVFCGLFNGVRPIGAPKRTWRLTARGGLQEITDGKPAPEPGPLAPDPEPDSHGVTRAVKGATAFWAELEANQPKKGK